MTLRMGLLWLLAALAVAAVAERLPVDTLDGGGASAAGSAYRLSGTIGAYALPAGAPRLSGALNQVDQGFYPAVLDELPPKNAADPAWLELGDPPTGVTAPAPLPLRLHACSQVSSARFEHHRIQQRTEVP
jgi:hypothetical protein